MYPCLSVSDLDILVYLFVERADVWVCGGEGSELVALSDEYFCGVGEVGNHIGNVAAGDMFFGGLGEDVAELLLPDLTGGGPLQKGERLLRVPGVGVPVCFFEVCEGSVRGFWAGHRKDTAQVDEDGEMVGI